MACDREELSFYSYSDVSLESEISEYVLIELHSVTCPKLDEGKAKTLRMHLLVVSQAIIRIWYEALNR